MEYNKIFSIRVFKGILKCKIAVSKVTAGLIVGGFLAMCKNGTIFR